VAEQGDRIKAARGRLTQKEYAEKLGVDNTTIASWEIGRREPDLDILKKMADMCGVSLDWLAGRYDYDIEKAKVYNSPNWREIIEIAIDNNISPKLLKPVINAIATIKKS